MSRFVRPDTTRLPLTGGDFIVVKAALNAGEHDELFDRSTARDADGAPILDDAGKPRLDPTRTSRALLLAYLLDWSLTDDDGHVVDIRRQPAEVVEAATNALDFESRVEILNAISQHDTRVRTARAEEKKRSAESTELKPTSISLVGVGGGTNG